MLGLDVDVLEQIGRVGFAIVPEVVGVDDVKRLIAALHACADDDGLRVRRGQMYAARNLLTRVPAVAELAASSVIRSLVEQVLGSGAKVVRGLLFDKTPGANWKVVWHQDLSIAVWERIDVGGFGPWSMKSGVQHVQPPARVLEQMLTVRVHLDDCFEDNGPLLVLPASHDQGVLSPAQIAQWRQRAAPASCIVCAGGVVLMRPLLLHASSAAITPRHRRVIHLEYAAQEQPGGLQWAVET
ncbi:MAG TPA: phytanoyl-CoA dioxygenase family protein [Bryobacteraceae bacterium]|nr:phytanoyl-CoA dioxygenase family protein [Bryobacteraceae bacterium]